MLRENQSIDEVYITDEPRISERSRLYHLQPVGISTQLVESLTGYIARLAESHCLLSGVLISNHIAPNLNSVFVKKAGSRGLHALFARASALNGTGTLASDFVSTLETLTLRKDLSCLTLLGCAEVIPIKNLFNTHKAWCPHCYEDWRISKQVIYEPLLWTIKAIKVCPQHQQALCNNCPNCDQRLPVLTWQSFPGYCSSCGTWLGKTQSTNLVSSTNLTVDELTKQIWIADTIGELLATLPFLSSPVPKTNVAKSFRIAVDIVTKGNISAFARLLGIPKNTLWGWYSGKNLPLFDELIKTCHFLGLSMLDFLTQETLNVQSFNINGQKTSIEQRKSRQQRRLFDSQRVKDTLLAVLESDKEPPPTMQEVANSLKYDRRTIFRHFPDLCRAIAAKSCTYKKALHCKKIEQSCQEVQQIAFQLYNKDIYPSEARVAELITMPGYLRYKQVREVLHEVQLKGVTR